MNSCTQTIPISLTRALQTTPVYDTYWRFAVIRQQAFFNRIFNTQDFPVSDSILSTYRFTNVYRASDRVSQYLIRNVIYDGPQSPEEVFFRIILFKIFNKIETWENLIKIFGQPSWKNFDILQLSDVLDNLISNNKRIYSPAYIMPCPSFGRKRKHKNHLYLIDYMMRDGAPKKISNASNLRQVYDILFSYPSLGPFLAYQFTIDLNYSEIIDFSEMDFVVAGPGANSGIRKCFKDTGGLSDSSIIELVTERATYEFERLGLSFNTLCGRPLHLIDCQNLFCEVDKYSRIAHPEIKGTSERKRIKQKYKPNSKPLPQWYPPKWNLNVTRHPLKQQNSI